MTQPLYPSDDLLTRTAQKWGTPLYVYYEPQLLRQCRALKKAFSDHPTKFFFAVKAASNKRLLEHFHGEGFGADVVSVGELERALQAGIAGESIVYSGVGKRNEEIKRAMEIGIQSFHVESLQELKNIGAMTGELQRTARVSFRINPDIDAQTLPYIATGMHGTKFGIPESDLDAAVGIWNEYPKLQLVGISCHLGSQITEYRVFRAASERCVKIAEQFRQKGIDLEFVDLGGGLAVQYEEENVLDVDAYARALLEPLQGTGLKLYLEPGRWLVAESGHLLTRVLYTKQTPKKTFIIVDASMTELIRPALYGAKHTVHVLNKTQPTLVLDDPKALFANLNVTREGNVDIVGPVCESGDFLLQDHWMTPPVPGDLLVFRTAGAYGMSMASGYNSRPLPAEVLATKESAELIRRRQPLESLWQDELGISEVL
jgi:diaminopimelate decarboxylase